VLSRDPPKTLQPEIEEPGAKALDEFSHTAGTEALTAGYTLIQAKAIPSSLESYL